MHGNIIFCSLAGSTRWLRLIFSLLCQLYVHMVMSILEMHLGNVLMLPEEMRQPVLNQRSKRPGDARHINY